MNDLNIKLKPNLIEYLEWKVFLKDSLEYRKQEKLKPFSLAEVSKVLEFKSKSYLHNLINDSKVNPTEAVVLRVVLFLELNEFESEYFSYLVKLNRSDNVSEKNEIFKQIGELIRNNKLGSTDFDKYEYFSNWYFPVVKELVTLSNWDGKYSTLASWVKPAISVKEAKYAVKQLEYLELIKKVEENYVATEGLIRSGVETRSLEIFEFQNQMLNLAKTALSEQDVGDREISTITFSLASEKIDEFKLKIQSAQRDLVNWLNENQEEENKIYQFNWQMFALSEEFPPRGKK